MSSILCFPIWLPSRLLVGPYVVRAGDQVCVPTGRPPLDHHHSRWASRSPFPRTGYLRYPSQRSVPCQRWGLTLRSLVLPWSGIEISVESLGVERMGVSPRGMSSSPCGPSSRSYFLEVRPYPSLLLMSLRRYPLVRCPCSLYLLGMTDSISFRKCACLSHRNPRSSRVAR